MASDLTFALSALASGPTARTTQISNNLTWKPECQMKGWKPSASTCTSVSAAVVMAVGQVLRGKARKGRVVNQMCRAFDPTKEIGVMNPTGFWDPLNLMREDGADGPFKSEETFRWYREAELKHGRVCMVALTGLFIGTISKLPGFEKVPAGFAALNTSEGGAGLAILILIAGIFELDILKSDGSRAPGVLGDNWGITGQEEQEIFTTELRNKELAHCRMAMSAMFTAMVLEYNGVAPETFLKLEFISPNVKAAVVFLFFAWTSFEDGFESTQKPSPAAKPLPEKASATA